MNKEIDNLIIQFRGKTFCSTKDAEDWLKGKVSSLLEAQRKDLLKKIEKWKTEEGAIIIPREEWKKIKQLLK